MKVIFMSDKGYDDKTANHGDCILVDTGSSLVIYDCGCGEHAEHVLAYMKKAGYTQAEFILSHNDADHFDGLPHLIEAGVKSLLNSCVKSSRKPIFIFCITSKRILSHLCVFDKRKRTNHAFLL